MNSVINQLDAGTRVCQCNLQCTGVAYHIAVSQSIWPSMKFEVRISLIFISASCMIRIYL